MMTKTPELMIDQREAKVIGDATLNLMAEYGSAIDPRAMAWANFTMALGGVYGMRIIAIAVRKGKERAIASPPARTG